MLDARYRLARRSAQREAKFFLRMPAKAMPELKAEARTLWQEATELHLILARIYRG